MYLYMNEDMTIYSAFELYQLTGDLKDFLDTLFIIEKENFFKDQKAAVSL